MAGKNDEKTLTREQLDACQLIEDAQGFVLFWLEKPGTWGVSLNIPAGDSPDLIAEMEVLKHKIIANALKEMSARENRDEGMADAH